jgi:hypothetical protein
MMIAHSEVSTADNALMINQLLPYDVMKFGIIGAAGRGTPWVSDNTPVRVKVTARHRGTPVLTVTPPE